MSLLGKLFGSRTLEDERAQADALFAEGELGKAKLAYDRALALAKGRPDQQKELNDRIAACRDAIASEHLAEAERLLSEGQVDFARDELQQVRDTAADIKLVRQADEKLDQLERDLARAEIADHATQSDEDRFELIAGGFENDQYAEYLAHGEPVKRALLLLHDGQMAQARALLEETLATANGPRFLWFELGRARLADGDSEGGQTALEKFLASLHADEGGDPRLLARIELAQLAHARGDFDTAVAHHEAALEAMPHDPRPYLAMAQYFRREKLIEEAIEVLEAGMAAVEDKRPDLRFWQELGLSFADAGRDAQAIEWLERVVALLASQKQTDLPPESAVRLAELYERSGRAARALDLYALLARGSDRANLHLYHEQTARLMTTLGMTEDAHRMLLRARELAPNDDAVHQRIDAALQASQPSHQPEP
ncbi:MAG: tetratricopeptide repeat protein [Polyangiales bacterium]